jgi:DNA-binding Xre family transcriptional regulator
MLTYKKLFKLLIDRRIRKGELQKTAGITASIMARLAKDETVKSNTINRICAALDCQPGDIMEYVPDVEEERIDN